MKEQLIQLAEEKGFKDSFVAHDNYGYLLNIDIQYLFWMTALQKHLRELHNVHIVTYVFKPEDTLKYCCDIISDKFEEDLEDDQDFNTYEEALEQALFQALQLIK